MPSTKDYLQTNISTEDQDLEDSYLQDTNVNNQTGHFASNGTANIERLCNDNTICDKIIFSGKFTDTEKYTYTKIFSKIVQFIADNSNEDQNIQEVIHKIQISKENGNRR
jgi:hypothetical protein